MSAKNCNFARELHNIYYTRMKKVLSLVCAALLSLGMIQANVLLSEHFDRTLGTLSASTWSSGSLPNDSNWHTYSPGSVQFQVVSKQLKMTDYCTAESGKAVEYSANHSRDYILFKNAFAGADGDKVLMAFLLKVDELQTTSGAQSATNANNSILSFAINESNNALGSLNGRVLIKTVDASTYNLGVSRRGETPEFAETNLKTGTTYLIVAEYAFVDGEKNDIVNLYINPTKDEQTIVVTSVNPSSASADVEKLVGIALCSNGNTPTGMLIDEIRVATDWQELWEDSSVPTPAISVAGSLSFDKVTIGEATETEIIVKGANLQGAIAVASDNAVLVPAVSSIAQGEAEKDGGYALTLTLTATKEGAGSANLTLSSAGASDQIVVVSWTAAKPVPPTGTELLGNGNFEEYSCNAMFGCSFDEWNLPLGSATAEENDKLDGDVSMSVKPSSNAALDQGVTLNDADYAAGTLFQLTIHYKVLSIPSEGSIDLDCYWEPAGSGDAEAMKQHDADVLQRSIATAVSSEWEELTVTTSKPANSTYFRVRLKIPKNAQVLLDAFSLVQTENEEPYINVLPSKLSPVETTIGNSVTFQTLHIKQGNLSGTTVFELSYTDADQFSLSTSSLAADQSECDLVITYAPTAAGSHIAYLNIDNEAHPILHQTIKLEGTCTDPSKLPTISVTPSELSEFETVIGQEATKTVSVTSENCTDYLYMRIAHISPAEHGAFVIDGSMLPKNGTSEVTVRFKPLAEGTYQSTLTIYSEGAESVVVTLNGTATKASEETIDWKTQFTWGESEPLTQLEEHFDAVDHNKTLVLEGWQNVAAVDERPWWGFDESKTSPARGEGKYAKATAYQYAKETTGVWETWLVTPALDYKNADIKTFTFSVMGEYLPDEESETVFEVYYIDPDVDGEPFFQNLTESFAIPKVGEDNLIWYSFYVDLAPFAETMADVFHMAFRYYGPNGGDGAVTYYVDDVTWGVFVPSGTEQVNAVRESKKILRDGQLIILHDGKEYTPLGQEIK